MGRYILLFVSVSCDDHLTNLCCPFSIKQIYSAEVSVFLGGNKPSRTADLRGDISVNFSCDPEISSKLVRHCSHTIPNGFSISLVTFWSPKPSLCPLQVDLALEEIVRLQEEGPSQEDISAILEIEQRAHENGLQVSFFAYYSELQIHHKNHILLRKQVRFFFSSCSGKLLLVRQDSSRISV